MPMNKPHLEFHPVDMKQGWVTPPGYPAGIQQKILASDLDETRKMGSRTRLLRFEPGVYTTAPFVHDHWEEVYLVSGDLVVGNDDAGQGRRSLQRADLRVPAAGRPSRPIPFRQGLPAVRDPLLRREREGLSVLAPDPHALPGLRPFLDARAGFAAGTDTPRDFLERCLAALDDWEPKVDAFVNLNIAGARAAADALDRALARRASRCRRSTACRSASRTSSRPPTCRPRTARRSSPAGARTATPPRVAALREAGAVIVGKTVTTEFAATRAARRRAIRGT